MRLLLVEDSAKIRKYVKKALEREGFAVDLAADGEEGLYLAESVAYDAILLDLMLPKLDGITVLRRLRSSGSKTYALILTAKDAVNDRVLGLDQGADDYLVKPFAIAELIARIKALTRRTYGIKSPWIQVGDLVINTSKHEVPRGREPITLQPREYAVLEYLALRRGEVVSRTEIEDHIYDDLKEPMSNVVTSAISTLRRKIDSPGQPSLIQTRRGMGYILPAAES